MIETKIVAFDYRCDQLVDVGIPFGTYWVYGVCYFAFPDELSLREALDLFGL